MANKATTFLDNLETVLGDYTTNDIKSTIGHSTNNHRVATVSQVILFLEAIGEIALAESVENVYSNEYVKNELILQRSMRNNRTDGYDINEFISAVYNLIGSNATITRDLGRAVVAA